MRLFTANGAHMSRMGSVSAWAILDAAQPALAARKSRRPESDLTAPTPIVGTAEAVYYATGCSGMVSATSYTEKP
jgi:hypothetical protein